MFRRLIVLAVVASFAVIACASAPAPERPIDKEGIQHRSDESKQKLF